MPVTIDLAVAKTHKFATRESGDTAELVERPGGGVSLVVADGQGSGAAAKRLSLAVAGKVVSLLNDGVRDGAAARAANDFLFAQRDGRVTCALEIVSLDLASRTLLITRNSEVPMLLNRGGRLEEVWQSGGRIGTLPQTRPVIMQYAAEPGLTAILMTDGVVNAGRASGDRIDLEALVYGLDLSARSAIELSDEVLARAMQADHGRPHDDMTVVAVRLGPRVADHPIRRLAVSVPLQR